MNFILSLALVLSFSQSTFAQDSFADAATAGAESANMETSAQPLGYESAESAAEMDFLAEKKVRGVDLTCSDLQSLLQKEGALNILSGRHNWGVVHYASAAGCGIKFASPARVRTADRRSCFAGFICLRY